MNKIQPTSFKNVGEFLDVLPDEERSIVLFLRDIILSSLYPVIEKLTYNVPFYYGQSRICFIWPSSIPWGGIKKGVALGFCHGHLLSDNPGYLEKAGRKEVTSKTFLSFENIVRHLVKSYLLEAQEIDKLTKKK